MNTSSFKKYRDALITKKFETNFLIEKHKKAIVICFIEGVKSDFAFYRKYVEKVYSNLPFEVKIKSFVSDGKESVIKDFEVFKNKIRKFHNSFNSLLISTKYKIQVLFFVDKDYSDFLNDELYKQVKNHNHPYFFITKYYSIENYYINSKIFISYLNLCKNYKQRKIDSPLALNSKYDELFKDKLIKFYIDIKYLLALIILDRKNNKILKLKNIPLDKLFTEKLELKVDRNNIVKEFIKLFIKKINEKDWKNYNEQIKKILLPDSEKLIFSEFIDKRDQPDYLNIKISEIMFYITGCDHLEDHYQNMGNIINHISLNDNDLEEINKYLRGKYSAWFFEKLLNSSVDLEGIKDINLSPENNFIKILSPHLEIPEDLREMLEKNKQNLLECLQV